MTLLDLLATLLHLAVFFLSRAIKGRRGAISEHDTARSHIDLNLEVAQVACQSCNLEDAATKSFEDINGMLTAVVSEDNENWQI